MPLSPVDRYLDSCRRLSVDIARNAGKPDAALVVVANVAAHIARAYGVSLQSIGSPLLDWYDPTFDAQVYPPDERLLSPELLSEVAEALLSAADRRQKGAHYTPPHIARRLCDEVLRRVDKDPRRIRVCDPAVGGGVFLLAAARYLAERGVPLSHAIANCLFGADIEPMAAYAASTALQLLVAQDDPQSRPVHPHIHIGDSLTGPADTQAQSGLASAAAERPQLSLFGELQGEDPTTVAEDKSADTPTDGIDWSSVCEDQFDAVIGNPPFLNQLEVATTRSSAVQKQLQQRFGATAAGYANTANLFVALAFELVREGGVVGLIVPESFMATRDTRATRRLASEVARLDWIWRSIDKVFAASVQVCAPVWTVSRCVGEETTVRRAIGANFTAIEDLVVAPGRLSESPTWSWLFADAMGVPSLRLKGDELSKYCDATADFRDQFYGLIPFVHPAGGSEPGKDEVKLVTVGLIDPGRCLWDVRPTRFAKQQMLRPVVDLTRLREEGSLAGWATSRLVPKVMVSTQTRVLEAIVDHDGSLLPSIPTISVVPRDGRVWHLAAVLNSPVLSAWALQEHGGAALSHDAIKLSAKQLERLPAPSEGPAWDRAAEEFRRASEAADESEWLEALVAAGRATCDAYGIEPAACSALIKWWAERLPRWKVSD